jgi:hypothetical protein
MYCEYCHIEFSFDAIEIENIHDVKFNRPACQRAS